MLRMFYIPTVYILILFSTVICNEEEKKAIEGTEIAHGAFSLLSFFFNECFQTSMPNKRFIVDNLQNYINEFSKTTVGSAPQFTSNRKFFANMIAHPMFKNMLAKDVTALQNSMVKKIKFCDESAMDSGLLKQLYDREVDQTKL